MPLDWTDEIADRRSFHVPGEDPEINSPPARYPAIRHLPPATQVMRKASWAIVDRVGER
jgi:hypothetical protein